MHTLNKNLANIFANMAALYQLLNGENRFRTRAYQNASRVLDNMSEDVGEHLNQQELENMHGIGESIAEKIIEYAETGKIAQYEALKDQVPTGFIELLDVEGIGPKTLNQLHRELNVTDREELIAALESGEAAKLKGFGKKSVQKMLEALRRHERASGRILLADALEIAEEIVEQMRDCADFNKIEIAGSLRRRKTTIGDIDILVEAPKQNWQAIVECFVGMNIVEKVHQQGKTKASVQVEFEHRDADLRLFTPGQWGAALLYFTGSKAHNIHLRKIAKDKGWKINEYGLFRQSDNKKLAGKTEASIYEKLGLAWVPPELREENGEIELAKQGKLPDLIEWKNIRGDLHMHSDWSDGLPEIAELAEFISENFDYEYIVVSDHSKSSRVANGLDEKDFREQFEEIQKVNDDLGKDFVKRGVEVDILPDGSLDFEDHFLAEFDWVTASIHARFDQDNTERLLKACENRYVNCIGHPTGRLIGKREGYPVDLEKLLTKAKETGTALEVNAQPARMDLEGSWIRAAVGQKVMLVITTDSHQLGNFDLMKLGVGHARRGWCTRDAVLNTKSWREIKKFVQAKREK